MLKIKLATPTLSIVMSKLSQSVRATYDYNHYMDKFLQPIPWSGSDCDLTIMCCGTSKSDVSGHLAKSGHLICTL